VCEHCLGPLEPAYDPSRRLPSREEIAARPPSLWRYAEWLPIASAPRLSLDSGFTPLIDAPALARALVATGGDVVEPVVPKTIARSIAIGNPADGRFAARAIRGSGGAAAAVDDAELVGGIRLLAETTGVFTETAGGATVAAAAKLAREGRLRPSDEVVLCITGNGLKTVEAVQPALPHVPVIDPKLREVAALVNA